MKLVMWSFCFLKLNMWWVRIHSTNNHVTEITLFSYSAVRGEAVEKDKVFED